MIAHQCTLKTLALQVLIDKTINEWRKYPQFCPTTIRKFLNPRTLLLEYDLGHLETTFVSSCQNAILSSPNMTIQEVTMLRIRFEGYAKLEGVFKVYGGNILQKQIFKKQLYCQRKIAHITICVLSSETLEQTDFTIIVHGAVVPYKVMYGLIEQVKQTIQKGEKYPLKFIDARMNQFFNVPS